MPKLTVAYLATGIVFCLGDFLWLGFVAKDFYQAQIGTLLLAQPGLIAASIFYALYVFGVVVFAVAPALESGSIGKAALRGALFGLIAYATYDLSNLATLKGWPLAISMVDIAWGTFATAVSATLGYCLTARLSASLRR